MPYQFHGDTYAHYDYVAAKESYKHASYECRTLAQRSPSPARLRAALKLYRLMRDRLLDVREYVTEAGGHPELPVTPLGVVDPDAL
jgi:hypothetical protein